MSTLPAFREACLASGKNNVVSLIGSNNPGELEVYSIDLGDLNAATFGFRAKDVTGQSWDPSLPKYCFSVPSDDYSSLVASLSVTAIQFGKDAATMGSFAIQNATGTSDTVGLAGGSPKLFTRSMAKGGQMFNAYVRDGTTGSMVWKGVLMNFETAIPSELIRKGTAFAIKGNVTEAAKSNPFITYGESHPVTMNGNTLTEKAVPISMSRTSYILDKSASGTVDIYSITPGESYLSPNVTLTKIKPQGDIIPSYSGTLVATYIQDKAIVIYTINDNTPKMTYFDITTSKWTPVQITAGGSSSSGGGGGLSTALGVVLYVAAFLLLACIIKCFWGTIQGLFFCIKGGDRNENAFVVEIAPPIELEKVKDPPPSQPQFVYIDNTVNNLLSNSNNNSNNKNNSDNTNNSVNNNSVNHNNN
ncbi:hypothetical protein BGZ96_000961, partial [Linnemannia gamsii]